MILSVIKFQQIQKYICLIESKANGISINTHLLSTGVISSDLKQSFFFSI